MGDAICCGRECSTAFCPHCGQKVGDPNPGIELVNFLRHRAAKCKESTRTTWEARLNWAENALAAELGDTDADTPPKS